jgi:hypothetical protein
MIEKLDGMPAGTLGYRATGSVTADEYRDFLLPEMRAAAEAGDVRMVFAVGPGFDKFEVGALTQDIKAGLSLGIGHPRAWTRAAVVTDVDWIAKATQTFGWMTPGEVKLYRLDDLEKAKAWVAERPQ